MLTFFQSTGIDLGTILTQLPVVAIALMIVWYFDRKNERKEEKFQLFIKEMQDDWQEYLVEQTKETKVLLTHFSEVIARHTEVLKESVEAKNKLIHIIRYKMFKDLKDMENE